MHKTQINLNLKRCNDVKATSMQQLASELRKASSKTTMSRLRTSDP